MFRPYRIVVRHNGGPEVLEAEELELSSPDQGQVLLRHDAIGLNFIDTYQRSGLYPVPLPSTLGSEAAGVVEAVGPGVSNVREGDRVGYFAGAIGAYSSHRTIEADALTKLPDAIGSDVAAASMLKGCTAEMLIERCARVQPGDRVLVHSAAGGVGSILVPWLKDVGAEVIGHAGTADKARRASELGADHVLSCSFEQLAAEVKALTDGLGVRVVLDGVGASSWEASLGSLARRGKLVSYGNASGPVPPFAPLQLARAGSLFLTRPTLFDYVATRDEREASAARLFEMIANGTVKPQIGARYDLRDVAQAHRALEARETQGSTILIP